MGMAENYKRLYEQMKKMLAMYQDEIVPGMRKTIDDLEKNQIKVRCKDCKWAAYGKDYEPYCNHWKSVLYANIKDDDFCSYGERNGDKNENN